MERDQFFSNLFNENSEQAQFSREQNQLAFEERIIKRLFSECGVKVRSWGMFVNQCREITGRQNLNFVWFNSSFAFPAFLCGRRFYGKQAKRLKEASLKDLLAPPAKNNLLRMLTREVEKQEFSSQASFAFTFPVVQTMFCIHNMHDLEDDGTRTLLRFRTGADILCLESTRSFFRSVGGSWFE